MTHGEYVIVVIAEHNRATAPYLAGYVDGLRTRGRLGKYLLQSAKNTDIRVVSPFLSLLSQYHNRSVISASWLALSAPLALAWLLLVQGAP